MNIAAGADGAVVNPFTGQIMNQHKKQNKNESSSQGLEVETALLLQKQNPEFFDETSGNVNGKSKRSKRSSKKRMEAARKKSEFQNLVGGNQNKRSKKGLSYLLPDKEDWDSPKFIDPLWRFDIFKKLKF